MRALLTAVGVVFVALFVGCSQPLSPTSPTSGSLGGPSTTTSGGNPTNTGIPAELVVGVAAAKEVPFKGRLDGEFTFAPDPPPSPFASVHFNKVTGNATHLGRFTVEAPHRVNLVNLATFTSTGTFEFTAANGDKLTADFTGTATAETPSVVSIAETANITGGTGRFAGATGSFIVTRTADLATRWTTGSFEGTISSHGAGNP